MKKVHGGSIIRLAVSSKQFWLFNFDTRRIKFPNDHPWYYAENKFP